MLNKDAVFGKITEALLCDYAGVYYVDLKTSEYFSFSLDPVFRSLKIEKSGEDFFKSLVSDVEKIVYEEDKHIFLEDITKESLLSDIKNGSMQKMIYRLMVNGKPVYHMLRLIKRPENEDGFFILGVLNIDKEMKIRQETERMSVESRIYNQIAQSLASYYDTIYYVDTENDGYIEFSSTTQYDKLAIPKVGSDFFTESANNIDTYVHPEDKSSVIRAIRKEHILTSLSKRKLYNVKYRLMIDGKYRYTRLNAMWADDKRHLLFCVQDIDEQVRSELSRKELEIKSVTYTQILNSLAYRYGDIYYLDAISGEYAHYKLSKENNSLYLESDGVDFFEDASVNIYKHVHEDDLDMIRDTLSKEKLLQRIGKSGSFSVSYRQYEDKELVYINLRAALGDDKRHIVLGFADIDEQVKRENEFRRELISANRKALNDELTGVKNMNAYQEMESTLQSEIDKGICQSFAVLICDLNNLKHINDTLGHKAGDEYIKAGCRIICSIFAHSPVYRIGGDEFVVILRSNDYNQRLKLFSMLRSQVLENCKKINEPVLASGIAEYDQNRHTKVSEVFQIADARMYENKKQLKRSVAQ